MLLAATGCAEPGLSLEQLMSEGGKEAVRAHDEVVAASEVRRLQ